MGRNVSWDFSKSAVGLALGLLFAVGCARPQADSNTIETTGAEAPSIIGGIETTGHEPFAGSVVSVYNLSSEQMCTGTLISNSTVLTAAHCVEDPTGPLIVIFGRDLQDETAPFLPVLGFEVPPLRASRAHETFDSGDIAVVKFVGDLPTGYEPIELLPDSSALKNGAPVVIAGYGVNNEIEFTGLSRLRHGTTTIYQKDPNNNEFILNQKNGVGECYGDSGGPAFMELNGHWYLAGVAHTALHPMPRPENSCSYYSLYSNVISYASWIKEASERLEILSD